MQTVTFEDFTGIQAFSYDSQKPTYFTEMLSCAIYNLGVRLNNGGFKIYIEESTPSDQDTALSTWQGQFSAWLSETTEAVSAWLLESSDSRGFPVIAAAPALPAIIGGSVVLYKGAIVAVGLNILSSVAKIVQTANAARRDSELPRILDSAFFKSSWFGLIKQPYLAGLLDSDGNPLADALKEIAEASADKSMLEVDTDAVGRVTRIALDGGLVVKSD